MALTGDTGIASTAVTPEALRPLLQPELPTMAEAMRLRGSTGACADCLDRLWPALRHALAVRRTGTQP
jgi:hypothetical protein